MCSNYNSCNNFSICLYKINCKGGLPVMRLIFSNEFIFATVGTLLCVGIIHFIADAIADKHKKHTKNNKDDSIYLFVFIVILILLVIAIELVID